MDKHRDIQKEDSGFETLACYRHGMNSLLIPQRFALFKEVLLCVPFLQRPSTS
jgi:hypothetical protein